LRICFAGTPEFAVPSLAAILESRHEVVLVVTQPDRPAGRRRQPTPPPVKLLATQRGLPIIQPVSINRRKAMEAYRAARPDAFVTVAYGIVFTPDVIAVPRLGSFNVHASLLPRYRGAAPIARAIQNGDRQTGVTVQRVVHEVDAGAILAQRALEIGPEETAGELSERLARLGAEILVPVLDAVEAGTVHETAQNISQVTYAPKLEKKDGLVPWGLDASAVCNHIRAMTPWPGAFSFLRGPAGEEKGRVILLSVAPRDGESAGAAPGTVVRSDAELIVATGRGLIAIRRIKPDGGKPMDATAYLRGRAVKAGDRFHGA